MLDIIIINRTKLLETFWPNTKLVVDITLEVISDLEILSIWIQIPSLNMMPLLVQIKLPPTRLEDKLELSQVPKMIQILLRIHHIGIATHTGDIVNICNTLEPQHNKNINLLTLCIDKDQLMLKFRTEILSTVTKILSAHKIVSLAQIKLLKLMFLMETQMKSIQILLMMELTFKEDTENPIILEILSIVIQTLSAHTMECTELNITQRSSRASKLDTIINININQENSKTSCSGKMLCKTRPMHMMAITTL